MEIEIMVKKAVDVKYVIIEVNPRYLEDSCFNGNNDDEDGTLVKTLVPGIVVNAEDESDAFQSIDNDIFLRFKIDAESGLITNWTEGVTSDMHYKSVDYSNYHIVDADGNVVMSCNETYVLGPGCINDYGDYFVPNIDKDGYIKGWDKGTLAEIVEEMNNTDN